MRRPLVVASALGGAIGFAVAMWMQIAIFPTDPQAAISVIYLAPLATAPGATVVGLARPSAREAAIACAIVYACVWLPLLASSPVGIILAVILALPTLLLAAPIVVVTGLLADVIGDLRPTRK